jgi:hypothetical protein
MRWVAKPAGGGPAVEGQTQASTSGSAIMDAVTEINDKARRNEIAPALAYTVEVYEDGKLVRKKNVPMVG